jgi:hypothetical protein
MHSTQQTGDRVKRLRRIARNGATITSGILCILVVYMRVQSRILDTRVAAMFGGDRYTIHVVAGKIIFNTPPPPGPMDARANQIAARMSNRDIQWMGTNAWIAHCLPWIAAG